MKATHWLILFLVLITTGCERVTQADKDAAIAAVRRNVEAMQQEKVEEVLATVHPESPSYEQTRQIVNDIAEKFQLRYELSGLQVELATPDTIRVAFEQVTESAGEADEFPANKVFGVHLLKKDKGTWKIWATEVRRVERLDAGE